MRKKYLSALLFGALLFASAGTFTSCKDYDDDIDNLQSQIDKAVSDLASLKSTIDNLNVGVTSVTFDEKTGELKVTTDGQSPVTYTIKTIVDVPVQEIKITVDGQDLKVNGEVVGKVGDTVKVVNDELTINGEGTGIKVGKYAILENVADNKYTISLPDKDGNLQTIELLRAIPTNLQIQLVTGNYVFSDLGTAANVQTGGIFWGVAGADVDWTGPKGAVKKNQALDGQDNTLQVKVIPANTELDAQVLKFVDSEGNVAPVNVSAVPAETGTLNSGDRSTDKGGTWVLSVDFNEGVTKDNAGSVFATKVGSAWKNKYYALSVNGTVASDYKYIIDTQTSKYTTDVTIDNANMSAKGTIASGTYLGRAEIGKEIQLVYTDKYAYDYQFYFPESEINDAEEWGIVLENNVLKATSDKAANKTIKVTARVLGVNGVVKADDSKTISVTFAPSTIEAIEIAPTTVKIDPTKTGVDVIINMQDVFTSLTSAEAISLSTANSTWSIDNDNFLKAKGALTGVQYYMDAACSNDKKVDFDDTYDNIKKIQYAKFNVTSINSAAKPGDYTLTLNLKDATANEVKKVTVPVTVTIPTFDEIFEKSAAWNAAGEILTLRLDQNGSFMPMTAYKTSVIKGTPAATDRELAISFDKISSADVVTSGKITIQQNTQTFAILPAAIDDTAHKLKTLTAQSSYKVQGIAGFEVKSAKYTVNLISPLEGAQLVKYVDGAAAAIETTPGTTLTIDRLPITTIQASGEDKDGFAFVLNGKDYIIGGASTATKINMVHRYSEENLAGGWTVDNLIDNAIDYSYSFDSKAGNDASLSFAGDKLTIKNLAEPSIGTTEYTTTVKISVSDVKVGTKTVQTVIEVPVTVKK